MTVNTELIEAMPQENDIQVLRQTYLCKSFLLVSLAAFAFYFCTLAVAFAQPVIADEGLRLAPSQDLGSRATSDYISTGAAPVSIRSTPVAPSNPIRIDAGTRLQINSGGSGGGGGGSEGNSGGGNDSSFSRQSSAAEENFAINNRSRTEFQQLIFKTRGKDIEHFGLSLFGAPPTSYALVDRITPPADYVIAPGDEVRVRAWGQVDIDFVAKIERNGVLYIPLIGGVQVAGVSFSELKNIIRNRIARQYKGFEIEVMLGQINLMQVFVTGRAAKPGAYTIGGLSSLVNAVFAVGGPAENGSMRKVQLKRNDKIVTELDLYDFITKGDKSKDVRLQSGDVIYFPPVLGYAAIAGSVQNSAIYEVTSKTTLKELIDLAGGLSTTAGAGRVIVERIENRQARVVAEFNTDPSQTGRLILDGDVVQINPISARFENVVTLRGHVPESQRLSYKQGMRVTDLVPNQMSLLANQYWQKRNEKGRGYHWLLDKPITGGRVASNQPLSPSEAMLSRTQQSGGERTPSTSREAGDRSRLARPDGVTPLGRVRANGSDEFSGDEPIYRTLSRPNTSRADMLDELTNTSQDIYWEYALIERFDPKTLKTLLIPFHLGKAIVERDTQENKLLEPGDVVTIFSQRDIRVPVERQSQYVRIEGEVARPGIYQITYGQSIASVISQAGGLTDNAYVFGTELIREETRELQQQELDSLIDRLGESLERSASTRLRESLDGGGSGAPDASAGLLDSQRRLVKKLRLVRASGRILLDMESSNQSPKIQLEKLDVAIQDGDRLFIPAKPSTVFVLGAVNRPNAMIYRPGRTAQDYISSAGGVTKDALPKDVLLSRANGSVQNINANSRSLFGGGESSIQPGDTILIPEDTDIFTTRRVLRDWTQIIYQGALGVSGLRLLSDVFKK